MRSLAAVAGLLVCSFLPIHAQNAPYDGLNNGLAGLYRLSDAKSYSISPENPTGQSGRGGMAIHGTASHAARDLGQGWKVNPYVIIQPGQTFDLANIKGAGEIEHIWMTLTGKWELAILRMYWDNEESPSVEVPVGAFFAMGWDKYAPVRSLAVCVNSEDGFNSYWPMPYRKNARITLENLNSTPIVVFYQIDYSQADVPTDAAYFHAEFREVRKMGDKQVYTILDGVRGKGQYVGTYFAWDAFQSGWWGEGEIKFYIDGDKDFPTINGTGTEDYINGSNGFINPETGRYETFTSPYSGFIQVLRPKGAYDPERQLGLYRWHIPDPVRFSKALRVTIQDLGWQSGGRYLTRNDGIASVAYWYQTEPHVPFPKFPDKDQLEIR